MTSATPLGWTAGLRPAFDAVRSWIDWWRFESNGFVGRRVASVPVTIGSTWSNHVHTTGTLVLLGRADGTHRLGVEMQGGLAGTLLPGRYRWSFTLDEVLDVRWEPGVWAGTLVVTPLERGALRELPGRPRGEVRFRVARRDRGRAEAFARAVALADLPD